MLKKSLLSLAVSASVLGLAGCNISSTTDSAGNAPASQLEREETLSQFVYPLFDPVNTVLPIGIDLIFAAASATDGTADAGLPAGNPVIDAINDLDGGISTLAPIDLKLSGSVDPATVNAMSTVWLVRLPNAADVQALNFPDVGGGYNIGTETEPKILSAANYDALDVTHAGALLTSALYTDAADYAAAANLFGAKQPAVGSYEASVLSIDGGTNNMIRISPTTPLDPKTKYIAIVTNGVTDASGTAIQPSPDYATIKAGENLISPALVDVGAAINGWESLAMGYVSLASSGAITADNVAISSAFTTVDPQTVLTFMANPDVWVNAAAGADVVSGNAVLQALLSTVKPTARTFELIKNAGGAGVHQIPVSVLTDDSSTQEFDPALTDNVLVSQGAIQLPQYTVSLATDAGDYWSANTTVGGALDPTGNTPPSDVDGEKNVTHRYPLAQKQRDVVVPVMMFEPIPTDVATFLASTDGIEGTTAANYTSTGPGGAGCGASQPGSGWPVVIMQHGFTSERTGNLINGSKVADLTCSVVIAMDLPHHGIAADSSRLGLGVDYVASGSEASYPWAYAKSLAVAAAEAAVADESNVNALNETILDDLAERHENLYLTSSGAVAPMDFANGLGGSGTLWIRLDNFQRTRDNMRQGVMDLMNLNASLGNIDVDGDDSADLDTSNVTYVGHSLGGIIGTTFVAVNNLSVNGYGNANLNQIDRAVLATPGGHLTKLIENSVALSGQVLNGLAGSSSALVQGNSTLESYMKVFQATVDSADPMNFIENLKSGSATSDIPVLVVGMYGNGSTNPADLVVPVNGEGIMVAADTYVLADASTPQADTARSPLVGLDPMLELLGAENVVDTPADDKFIAKYSVGGHGTFSSAGTSTDATSFDSEDAYAEMLSQTVQLILTDSVATADENSVLISDAP